MVDVLSVYNSVSWLPALFNFAKSHTGSVAKCSLLRHSQPEALLFLILQRFRLMAKKLSIRMSQAILTPLAKFTFGVDKIITMSGLARLFASIFNSKNLAGL